ncbi:MAG TPA: hypothetical protein VHZ55_03575 [Bryobacteraceae bacterium]|jgi:hypothetical protein|nr:hypothetical protein [Bryobacteraceae bacterium]
MKIEPGRDVIQFGKRPGKRTSACGGSPTAITKSASDKQMQIGPIGTPSTWYASNPAQSCHSERWSVSICPDAAEG